LRFHALDRQSLWDDEMSTRKDMSMPLSAWPQRFRTFETHPPLYFLQLRLWQKVTGSSLTALRANSALWGSINLALIFFLMRRYQGTAGGLAAMALLACSPYHLAYSQEMRSYTFAITLGLLGFLVLENCLTPTPLPMGEGSAKHGVRLRWIVLTLVFSAELYTHYWGSFVVAAQLLYGWVQVSGREQKRGVLTSGSVAAGLFGFWLPFLWSQMHLIGAMSFWVPPASPANLAKTLVAFTGLFFNHASYFFRAPGPLAFLIVVGLATFILAALGVKKEPRAAVIWLSVGLGIPYILSYEVHGLYIWYRYPILMYPAFLMLVTSGLCAIPSRFIRWGMFGLLVVSASWSCKKYLTSWQKANPKAVVAYVQELKQPGTVVIRPAYFSELFAFYDQGPTVVVDEDKLSSPENRAALKGKNVVFLAFDAPDPIGIALLSQFSVVSARYFPGYAHLGITVNQLN